MAKQGQGDHYYNTDYKFSPRVRELLAKKMENKEMSYMRAENIVTSVMQGKYKETLTNLNDRDKEKLMGLLKQMFSTNLPNKNVDVVVNFLNDNYTEDEIKEYVDHALTLYKPGMIYNGIRISNHSVIYFIEKLNTYPLMKGIVINKKYINDLIPFFDREGDDFDFDKDTLMVEKDYTNEMLEVFNGLVEGTDVRFHMDDDIFILATFDDEVAKSMEESFKGLEVQSIPIHMFDWSESNPVEIPAEKEKSVGGKIGAVIDKVADIMSNTETDAPELPPVDVPKDTLYSTTKPEDVIIIGSGTVVDELLITDDYYPIVIKENGKTIKEYFETDGGVCVRSLKHSKDILEEEISINGDIPDAIDYMILRNFVGEINLSVILSVFDKKKTKIVIEPSVYNNVEYLQDISMEHEEKTEEDCQMDVIFDIVGTYDSSDKLTMEIYNSL